MSKNNKDNSDNNFERKEVFQIWVNDNKDMCLEDENGEFHLYQFTEEDSFEQSVISNKPDGFDSYMLMTYDDLIEAGKPYIGESMIWVNRYFAKDVPPKKSKEYFRDVYNELEAKYKKAWIICNIDKGLIRFLIPLKEVTDQPLLKKYKESKTESDAEPKIYSSWDE